MQQRLAIVTGTAKESFLTALDSTFNRLRSTAQTAESNSVHYTASWGPREVLAHIALWAIQASENFQRDLPPLSYSRGHWGSDQARTFDLAFATLGGPTMRRDDAIRIGWDAVQAAGITLPLLGDETPEQHASVDDAFNAAAVDLVRGRTFSDVLELTRRSHENLWGLLQRRPAREYAPGHQLHDRVRLIIAHHNEHSAELERMLATVASPPSPTTRELPP